MLSRLGKTSGAYKLTDRSLEVSPLLYARFAGIMYLVIIIFGISSEVFIRSTLIVSGDATATATNILTSQSLFRAGFAFDVIMLFSDVVIAVIFYQLFKPVSKTLALMAAAFRLIQAGILGANLLNYYAPMLLLGNTGYMGLFEARELHAFALFFLELHGHGYDLGLLFFGLSNLLLGYLVIKSGFLPGILGYGLQAAAIVYLLGSFTLFLFPAYSSFIEPAYIIPLLAELSFCLWLLIKGIKTPAMA